MPTAHTELKEDKVVADQAAAAVISSIGATTAEMGQLALRAIDHMSSGIALFDASSRLLLCNRSYMHLYKLKPDVANSRCHLRELLEYKIKAGTFFGDV